MLPSMDSLAEQLAACSLVPPVHVLLPNDGKREIYMEARLTSKYHPPVQLEGLAFLKSVPSQSELCVLVIGLLINAAASATEYTSIVKSKPVCWCYYCLVFCMEGSL